MSRGKWPLARVEEVHPGRYGLVRAATVQTKESFLERATQRLHRLKVESATQHMNEATTVAVLVHDGEKLETNGVNNKAVPVIEP